MRLEPPDGNTMRAALVDRRIFEAVRVTDGQAIYRAAIDARNRVRVVEDDVPRDKPLTGGYVRVEDDATVRVKLAGGATDYVKEIPPDERDAVVTAAMLLEAVYGNPNPHVSRVSAVNSPYLALVRQEDPAAAWRKYPRRPRKRNTPLAEQVRRLSGQVRILKPE